MDLERTYFELQCSVLVDSLAEFFKASWHVLAPTTPLQWSWHLDELCAHLQAQLEGWSRRQRDPLYVNPMQNALYTLPPGTLKSRAFVIASAWAWAKWPSMHMLAISGNPRLSLRDSMLFNQLITSPWYVAGLRPAWRIRSDQDAKGAVGNTAGGVRLASGWEAGAVGEHVDWIQADDPHDPESVESEATRTGVLEKWDGSWANRVNDLASSIRSGIAQRTHQADWSAARITEGWAHLDLPMLFEVERDCTTPLGKPDRRAVDGECLHPERFTPDVIAKERARVRERRWSTLYQGRPGPAGGAMVKVADLRFFRRENKPDASLTRPKGYWTGPAVVLPVHMDVIVIAADLAGGKKTIKGDFNSIAAIGKRGADYFILEVWRKRADFPEVQQAFRAFAERYPLARKIVEAAASGIALVASMKLEISGLTGRPAKGDKTSRLESVLAFYEAGNVHFDDDHPDRDELIEELILYPNARHDDFVDTLSLGLSQCARFGKAHTGVDTPGAIGGDIDSISRAPASDDITGGISGEVHVPSQTFDVDYRWRR